MCRMQKSGGSAPESIQLIKATGGKSLGRSKQIPDKLRLPDDNPAVSIQQQKDKLFAALKPTEDTVSSVRFICPLIQCLQINVYASVHPDAVGQCLLDNAQSMCSYICHIAR